MHVFRLFVVPVKLKHSNLQQKNKIPHRLHLRLPRKKLWTAGSLFEALVNMLFLQKHVHTHVQCKAY